MGGSSSNSKSNSNVYNTPNNNFGNIGNDFGKLDFSNLFGGGLTLNYGTQYSGTTYDQKFGNTNYNSTTSSASSADSMTSKGGDGGGFDVAASVGVGVGGDGSGGSASLSKSRGDDSITGGSGGGFGGGSVASGSTAKVAIIGGGIALSALTAWYLLKK